MFKGYLEFAGNAIINEARTVAYCNTLLPSLLVNGCDECDDMPAILGHKPYTTPLVDQPDWFDPDDPDTWDFLGVYPLSMEGFEDATTVATVTEFMGDGGAVSAPRRGTRSMRVSALLIGTTEAAVSKGMTWLRAALRPGRCQGGSDCSGDHVCYFAACPPVCLDAAALALSQSPVVRDPTNLPPKGRQLAAVRHHTPFRECETGVVMAPISQCTQPYERHLYEVTVVDGPRITDEFDLSCGAMVQVEFTMVSGVPSPFGTAVRLSEPLLGPVQVPNTPCTISGQEAKRLNLAINPAPSSAWGVLPSFTSALTATPTRHESDVNRRSFTTTRTAAGGLEPRAHGAATNIRANSVIPGASHTMSVYGFATTAARGYLTAQWYNSSNVAVGALVTSSIRDMVGNAFTRLSMTLTAPSTASYLLFNAYVIGPTDAAVAIGTKASFQDALVESVPGAPRSYFDGGWPADATTTYKWNGTVGNSVSTATTVDYNAGIVDPNCPPVPTPPRPPLVPAACIEDPAVYTRYTMAVSADAVPLWSDAVPVIRVYSGSVAVRQLRIRFYSNPFEKNPSDLDLCDFCGEFIVAYLPAHAQLVLDGVTRTATIVQTALAASSASHLLYGSDGGPMVWPSLTCGIRYEMAIDLLPTMTGMSVELCVAGRE